MYSRFSLFQNPIDQAQHYWEKLLSPGDFVIDATCGQGKDTLFLAKLVLTEDQGEIYAIDLQSDSMLKSKQHLEKELTHGQFQRIHFYQQSHAIFPKVPRKAKLIVYNLGYLPGGDKKITTQVLSTLESIKNALEIVENGGAISITCYPGHPEGAVEEESLLHFCQTLEPTVWSCTHQRWLNRRASPSLLLIQKAN